MKRRRWWIAASILVTTAVAVVATPWLVDRILLVSTEDHYPDGAVWRVYHVKRFGEDEGQPHGSWRAYHPDGGLSLRGRKVNGKWHGVVVSYDTDGRPVFETHYEHGQVLRRKPL